MVVCSKASVNLAVMPPTSCDCGQGKLLVLILRGHSGRRCKGGKCILAEGKCNLLVLKTPTQSLPMVQKCLHHGGNPLGARNEYPILSYCHTGSSSAKCSAPQCGRALTLRICRGPACGRCRRLMWWISNCP